MPPTTTVPPAASTAAAVSATRVTPHGRQHRTTTARPSPPGCSTPQPPGSTAATATPPPRACALTLRPTAASTATPCGAIAASTPSATKYLCGRSVNVAGVYRNSAPSKTRSSSATAPPSSPTAHGRRVSGSQNVVFRQLALGSGAASPPGDRLMALPAAPPRGAKPPRPAGVTTWIAACVRGGVPFTRPSGGGNPSRGMALGRRLDARFKKWCETGVVAGGGARLGAIARALRALGVRVDRANVFVKLGGLRTHLDGLGVCRGEPCVLELKRTQSSLAAHRASYDAPCTRQPVVTVGGETFSNTERTAHMLQLAFGAAAHGAARGFVIVSCSDGVATYPLTPVPPHVYPATPPPCAASSSRLRPPPPQWLPWPGAKLGAPGWCDDGVVDGRVAVLTRGDAVALAVAATSIGAGLRPMLAAASKRLPHPPSVLMVSVPTHGRWRCYRVRPNYMCRKPSARKP